MHRFPLKTTLIIAFPLLFATHLPARAESEKETAETFTLTGDAERGAVIYRQYCISCHGETGRGDGPAGRRLRPRPYDLSDAGKMATVSDQEIFTAIKEGGASVGKSIFMTSFKGVLSDEQIHDVAVFVRSLATPGDPP